jgi:hypothetical protein
MNIAFRNADLKHHSAVVDPFRAGRAQRSSGKAHEESQP